MTTQMTPGVTDFRKLWALVWDGVTLSLTKIFPTFYFRSDQKFDTQYQIKLYTCQEMNKAQGIMKQKQNSNSFFLNMNTTLAIYRPYPITDQNG